HAVEREQRVDVVGHAPGEALEQITGDPQDHAGLRSVEPDRIDRALDHARAEGEQVLRRVGQGEEPLGRGPGRGVLGAQREDAGDQHAEGITGVVGHHGQRRPCPRTPGTPQATDHRRDVYFRSRSSSSRVRARGRSLAGPSATLVGAGSFTTRSSSRRASAGGPFGAEGGGGGPRRAVKWGSASIPFRKCSSAFLRSPPIIPGSSKKRLPASAWPRTERGLIEKIVSSSSRIVGNRKSDRIIPLVWPQRPTLSAYQTWASSLRGASSSASLPRSRPRPNVASFSSSVVARTSPARK